MREGRTAELVEQVLEGVIDVAVVSLPVETVGLVMKELFRNPRYLAVPEHHALAKAKTVLLRQFTEERLLILKDGHCLRDETLSLCDHARMRFVAQCEVDQFLISFDPIRTCGFGVSIVPDY